MAKREDDASSDDDDDESDDAKGQEAEASERGAEAEESAETATKAGERALATRIKGGEDLALPDASELGAVAGDDEPEQAAAQLGTDRYVLAGFFAAGLLGAYVIGRTLKAVWETVSNRDWFNQSAPALAAVSDDNKSTYSFIFAGIVALFVVMRAYRRADVRAWCDDVAGELAKVVWPSKKEVYNSTFIVIVASAMATLYLALLDRLWAFVTNIVYGDGS